ncbi:MAG: class E sortase [Actinomycetota bacterium]
MWGTGLYTASVQQGLRENLVERIEDPRNEAPQAQQPPQLQGDAWGILKIPEIDLDVVVVEGVSPVDLKAGPGHYIQTPFPWEEKGAVGIAGHRTTYGAPFWSLDELDTGDLISLATEFGVFRYEVSRSLEVEPSALSVLRQTRRSTLVLTTCSPRFSASRRLIVFADRI